MAGPALRKQGRHLECDTGIRHHSEERRLLGIHPSQVLSLHPASAGRMHDVRLSPPSSWNYIQPERADSLLMESGVRVMDTTKEGTRNIIGIHALVDTKTTVTGMCAVDLDEWPILREAGALVFAADTAPY